MKKAHQIQEIGEFQEFNDDVEYLLDALQVIINFLNYLPSFHDLDVLLST